MKKKNVSVTAVTVGAVVLSIMMAVMIFSSCNVSKIAEKMDASFDDIKEKGTFVIGVDEENAPMTFKNDAGNFTGFDIELAQMVCDKLKLKLEIKHFAEEDLETALAASKVDAIWTAYSISIKRNDSMEFSKPYIDDRQIFVVNKNAKIILLSDLKGLNLGVLQASYAEDLVDKDEKFAGTLGTVKSYKTLDTAMKDLAERDDLGAVLGSLISLENYIAKYPDKYKELKEIFGRDYYGIAYRKGSAALRETIDYAIDDLYKEGKLKDLSEKYFSKNIIVRNIPKLTDEELTGANNDAE